MKANILLVGAGQMAQEYAKVFDFLQVSYSVCCRSQISSDKFFKKTGKRPVLHKRLNSTEMRKFSHAVNAVSVDSLFEINIWLSNNGIKKILSEKPAAKNLNQLIKLKKSIGECSEIFIGYNRRFFSSIDTLKKELNDKIVRTVFFDFSEIFWKLDKKEIDEQTLSNWFFANSTHVLDTVFYLFGRPKFINCNVKNSDIETKIFGGNDIFSGSGQFNSEIPFSYIGDLHSGGRWRIEIFTCDGVYTLSPFEDLHKVTVGSLSSERIFERSKEDKEYKPGLLNQCTEFVGNCKGLLDLETHIINAKYYNAINKGLNLN